MYKIIILIITALSLSACFHSAPKKPNLITLEDATCPLPQAISNVDRDKVKDFGLKISDAFKKIINLDFKTTITDQTNIDFPDAKNVNRIYALTYAGCVACRVNKGNVSACANIFDEIISKFPSSKESGGANEVLNEAINYRNAVLGPILPPQ